MASKKVDTRQRLNALDRSRPNKVTGKERVDTSQIQFTEAAQAAHEAAAAELQE